MVRILTTVEVEIPINLNHALQGEIMCIIQYSDLARAVNFTELNISSYLLY